MNRRIALIFSLALILCLTVSSCTNDDWKLNLVKECESLVSDSLRAPASASFLDESIEIADSKSSYIRGSVDAENGFGARVRANFECYKSQSGMRLMYINERN